MIPALSIRQPWAWLIVNGFKDIENRDWPTNFRGRLLVHAGQTMARRYYDETCEELLRVGLLPASMPAYEDLPRGGFVGWTHVTESTWSAVGLAGARAREEERWPRRRPWPRRPGKTS